MRSQRKGGAVVGGFCATLGAIGIAVGFARPEQLAGSFLGAPIWAFLAAGGSTLAIIGGITLIRAVRANVAPANVVSARTAFHSRMSVDALAPPPIATSAAPRWITPSKLPTPSAPAQGRVTTRGMQLSGMDSKIRELTRRINKAGVMLATGQLSQQGYLAYVEDLKAQRGKLEAARVKAELH